MKRSHVALTLTAVLVLASEVRADCAFYVSSSIDDDPASGWLTGTETREERIQAQPGGVGGSITRTYEIGWYRMTDGSTQILDCRDYTPALLA